MEARKSSAEHVASRVLVTGKWLRLDEVTYLDEEGKRRSWERVSRTTGDGQEGGVDGVAVKTVLKRPRTDRGQGEEDCVVFVRQYRPAVQRYTLEFPAGLVDPGESPSQAALRELKEETGYTGRVVSCSPPLTLDGGLSSSLCCLVEVEVSQGHN